VASIECGGICPSSGSGQLDGQLRRRPLPRDQEGSRWQKSRWVDTVHASILAESQRSGIDSRLSADRQLEPASRQQLDALGPEPGAVHGALGVPKSRRRGAGVDEYDESWSLPADGLVLVTQQQSNDGLYCALVANADALRDSGIEHVYRIGDAVVSG